MLNKFLKLFAEDIAIDLGTANSRVYVKDRGIVIIEPSVVAVNQKTGQVLAIGDEAKKMVGRTPAYIVADRPLVSGVVSNFEVTEQMLRYFIEKVHKRKFLLNPRPRVIIGIPCGITEVEKKAVKDAAKNAGARNVFIIEEPMAAALGARLPIQDAGGNFIVDIGGGTTDLIIFQNGHVIHSHSIDIGGKLVTNDIAVGLKTSTIAAEELKIGFGVARSDLVDESKMIDVPVAGGERKKQYPQTFLAEIIEPRMEEIFYEVKDQI